MKVLFITRKYPPQVGGMEQFSFGLVNNFTGEKELIALNKSQKNLWWWIPYALIVGIIKGFKVDIIHLGDVVLAPIGFVIKLITRKPVVVTAHGLDVVYDHWVFKKVNLPSLLKLDKVLCVSKNTIQECLKRGVQEKKLKYIPNGIDANKFQLVTQHLTSNSDKRVMITVGRLVKRKGVNWFVRKVMPKLNGVEYLIIGTGPEKNRIEASIKELKLQDKVKMLGRISDQELRDIYNRADLFVMPNIKVEGDREGFGIVLLEAASVGLPVVAANLEGITDAIEDGKNGYLVTWGNTESYINKINELLNRDDLDSLRKTIKEYTVEHFAWDKIVKRYLEEFEKITK